jgi:hypothetical protein
MERTIKLHPDKADSGNGRSQKMDFWFDPEFWKRNPKRTTSKKLEKELGKKGAKEAILESVYRGEPPIENIPVEGEIQLMLCYEGVSRHEKDRGMYL